MEKINTEILVSTLFNLGYGRITLGEGDPMQFESLLLRHGETVQKVLFLNGFSFSAAKTARISCI